MNDEKVILTVNTDGSISAETVGITGAKCVNVVPMLEDLLDAQAIESAFTSDFYSDQQSEVVTQHNVEEQRE